MTLPAAIGDTFRDRSDAGSLTSRSRTRQQFNPCLHQRLTFLRNHAQERREGIDQVMIERVMKQVIGADRHGRHRRRQRSRP